MKYTMPNRLVASLVAVALVTLGFMPSAHAGVVSTGDLLDGEARQTQIAEVNTFLQREEVRDKLLQYGVSPESVTARVQDLSNFEIAELHAAIEEQVVGGDALAIIGAVFLIVLILEIVGVTDIFKNI